MSQLKNTSKKKVKENLMNNLEFSKKRSKKELPTFTRVQEVEMSGLLPELKDKASINLASMKSMKGLQL